MMSSTRHTNPFSLPYAVRLGLSSLVCLLLIALSNPLQAQRQLLDRVIAIVDSDVVLLSELEARLADIRATATATGRELPPQDELRQELLDQLILENLQLQLAERVSIRFDDDTINRVMGNMAQNNNMTFNEYVSTLEQNGVYLQTREEVRRQLTMQELQRGMVNNRITVTDQEIQNFLNSEVGREVMAADYLVEHILVPITQLDSAEAREQKLRYAASLVARINDGESLPAVRSTAATTGRYPVDGTNFGWRKADGLPNLFSEAVQSLKIGEAAGPIEAGNGFHIIQLADRRGGTEQVVQQANLRHIMLTPNEIRTEEQTKEQIREMRQRILDGEEFATLARQNSDDANTVVAGGDMDWVTRGTLPPPMEAAVDTLEEGEISEPIRTANGWHLIEVLDRRETDLSRQYARSQAANALRNRKFDLELQNWLLEIREEAFVEIVE